MNFYDIVEDGIHDQKIDFKQFKGKVVYLVNVASHCGYTQSNYADFKTLKERFANDPFEIVIAPCNSFGIIKIYQFINLYLLRLSRTRR
jgi:glutathione peroxidase